MSKTMTPGGVSFPPAPCDLRRPVRWRILWEHTDESGFPMRPEGADWIALGDGRPGPAFMLALADMLEVLAPRLGDLGMAYAEMLSQSLSDEADAADGISP